VETVLFEEETGHFEREAVHFEVETVLFEEETVPFEVETSPFEGEAGLLGNVTRSATRCASKVNTPTPSPASAAIVQTTARPCKHWKGNAPASNSTGQRPVTPLPTATQALKGCKPGFIAASVLNTLFRVSAPALPSCPSGRNRPLHAATR
jgi:hypothetical protein